jgi:hypothetical protein
MFPDPLIRCLTFGLSGHPRSAWLVVANQMPGVESTADASSVEVGSIRETCCFSPGESFCQQDGESDRLAPSPRRKSLNRLQVAMILLKLDLRASSHTPTDHRFTNIERSLEEDQGRRSEQ